MKKHQEFTDSNVKRSENEHPEQSYRRGYQQGAYMVVTALKEANLLDKRTLARLGIFVGIGLGSWRFAQKRRFKRHIHRDAAPTLDLKSLQSARKQKDVNQKHQLKKEHRNEQHRHH